MIELRNIQATLKTDSRESFIRLFEHVAKGIAPSYLHDRNNVPIIGIAGDKDSGKSLAAEAMMQTWIGGDSLSSLYKKEQGQMFLENYPMEAFDRPVYGNFDIAGHQVKLVFSSAGLLNTESKKAMSLITKDKIPQGGAIFLSDNIGKGRFKQQWLFIGIAKEKPQEWDPAKKWNKIITLNVSSKHLIADPAFSQNWQQLHLLT